MVLWLRIHWISSRDGPSSGRELRSHQTPQPLSLRPRARTPKEEKPPQQETRTATRESPCTTTKHHSQNFFFFKLKERIIQVSPGLVPGPGCWLLSNTEVLTGLLLSPFFPFLPGFLRASLFVWAAIHQARPTYSDLPSVTLRRTLPPLRVGLSHLFTGFCSLYDTPRNRPDR